MPRRQTRSRVRFTTAPREPETDAAQGSASQLYYDSLGTVALPTLLSSATAVLQAIIRSAPTGTTPSDLPTSRDECLAAVLALRDRILASTYMPPTDDSSALEELVSLTGPELMELGRGNPERLISIMKAAARFDSTLTPSLPDSADGDVVVIKAMAWKLRATEEALDQVRGEGNAVNRDGSTAATDRREPLISQDPSPSLLQRLQRGWEIPRTETAEERAVAVTDEPPPKQRRVSTIGGVPIRKSTTIPDSGDVGQVFRQALGGSSLIVPSQLGVYPGRGSSTATLRVNEIAGPSILLGLVQEGLNVELAIRNRSWRIGNGGEVLASEAEALTLARIVHLNLLAHSTMTEALEQCPWMEVALRRLFAVMYVENTASGEASRAAAWQVVQKVLEIHPTANIRVRTLDSMLAREAAASVKEMNALLALSKKEGAQQAERGRQGGQKYVRTDLRLHPSTRAMSSGHPRERTFPINVEGTFSPDSVFSYLGSNQPTSLSETSRIKTVANVLNYLYSGPPRAEKPSLYSTSAARRSLQSIANRTLSITPGLYLSNHLHAHPSREADKTFELPSDVVLEEGMIHPYLAIPYDTDVGEIRGSFKPLDCHRVDLPERGVGKPEFWMRRLPSDIQAMFDPLNTNGLQSAVLRHLDSAERNAANDFPRARLHCIRGHYGNILDMADAAGMIEWSPLAVESLAYQRTADRLTMSSFAVRKDSLRDRMISWPRTQNKLMPDPPYVDLPDPSIFGSIRAPSDADLQAFYFDVGNMFHNIRLPSSMAKLFPLRTVSFGDLPGTLQRRIEITLGCRPRQHERFRPLQATLPMGFKWAVYIAHTFAKSCFKEAYNSFIASSLRLQSPYRLKCFSRSAGIITLTEGDALLMHIIDDINLICFGWSSEDVSTIHRTCESIFVKNGLPIKRSKSTEVGLTERESLTFIGWEWDLRKATVRPRAAKINETIALTAEYFSTEVGVLRAAERVVGKLVWICMGCRALLSTLRQTFFALDTARATGKSDSLLIDTVRRELYHLAVLSPYARIDLCRSTWTKVVCVDASENAGAVVYCHATMEEIDNLISAFARYRCTSVMVNRREDADNSGPVLGVASALWQKRIRQFVEQHCWFEAFSHIWRRKEHINSLEAAAALLGMEWAVSHPITGSRILLLSDSMVVIGALSKGRSSSERLSLYCRRFCAVLLAHDVSVSLCYVPTGCNPADGPSRGRPIGSG